MEVQASASTFAISPHSLDIWGLLVKQIRKDTAQLAPAEDSVHVTSADIERDPDFFITEDYLKAFFSSH